MGASDLRVTVDSAKLRCVLDPALALGHVLGPGLARGLTRVFETWLTRSFWQVLDASELLQHRPRRAGPALQPDAGALLEWMLLRDHTDAGSWPLRWVGDSVAESQLHGSADEALVERYEGLASALALRQRQAGGGRCGVAGAWLGAYAPVYDPVACAADALVLSAALGGAVILSLPAQSRGGTQASDATNAAAPWPVQALTRLRLPVQRLQLEGEGHSLFAAERELVRLALASAGLAPLVQVLGPLAVVHVLVVPDSGGDADGGAAADEASARAGAIDTATPDTDTEVDSDAELDLDPGASDPWRRTCAWWYCV